MNSKVAQLNIPAIWKPIPSDEVNVRVYEDTFPYSDNRQLNVATNDKPIYRYAKNYGIDGLRFSLCLFTDEKNEDTIMKYLHRVYEKMDKQQVGMALMNATSSNFTYIEDKYEVVR